MCQTAHVLVKIRPSWLVGFQVTAEQVRLLQKVSRVELPTTYPCFLLGMLPNDTFDIFFVFVKFFESVLWRWVHRFLRLHPGAGGLRLRGSRTIRKHWQISQVSRFLKFLWLICWVKLMNGNKIKYGFIDF